MERGDLTPRIFLDKTPRPLQDPCTLEVGNRMLDTVYPRWSGIFAIRLKLAGIDFLLTDLSGQAQANTIIIVLTIFHATVLLISNMFSGYVQYLFQMALEIDKFHHILETTVNALSIIFNCYLLYLIKHYSTFGVKIYHYLLTIDALLDLCLAMIVFLGQPVALTGEGYFVMKSNGFLAGRSPALDSVLIILFAFFLHTNVLWIPVQFVYRYRLLCKDNSRSTQANIVIASVTVIYSMIALFVISAMCQVHDEFQQDASHVLDLNNWPKYTNGQMSYFVGSYITHWRMISWLSLWTFTCTASIFIVIWCEKRIVKNFSQFGHATHSNTRRMHKEFHRALLAMAICPLITTTVPVFYFCVTIGFSLCPGQISAIMTSGTTCITLFNPLTTIICFRCYRQITVRIVTCGKGSNVIEPRSTFQTHTSSNARNEKKPCENTLT